MVTDKRFSRTEEKIKAAFLEMIRTRPIHRISVKELCGTAQINRSTFYAHYSDIYALLNEVEEECFSQLDVYTERTIRSFLTGDEVLHAEAIRDLLLFLRSHDEPFSQLQRSSEENHFELHMIDHFMRLIEDSLQLTDTYERYSLMFHITGSFSVLLDWIRNDYPIPEEEMARIFIRGGML